MALADPKTYAKKQTDDDGDELREQIETLQAQVGALLEAQKGTSGGGITEDRLEKMLLRIADVTAAAQERAANPSNKTHPAISVYSYPEGDRERRRPDLKCPMFWCGYPIDWDTTTAEEVELLNQAEVGTFTFKRTDRKTPETLTVTGDRDAKGNLSRLLFTFPVAEQRATLPPMAMMLRDAFGVKSPEEIELDKLRAEVASLKARTSVSA